MPKKRMTEKEYLERLSGLFEQIRAGSAEGDTNEVLFQRYREAEFDLTVDYRLSTDFPADRKAALRAVHRQVQDQTEELKRRFQSGELSKQAFAARMQAATAEMAEKYATVLTEKEMAAFFGEGEGVFELPLDPDEME